MRARFRRHFNRLLIIQDTPHSVATGATVGFTLGFTPLFGMKTLLALLVAALLRVNKVAAVIAVSLHDLVFPLWPVIYRAEYDIGFWLLHHPHQWPADFDVNQLNPQSWLHWTTFATVIGPTLLGAVVVATPVAWLTFVLVGRYARRLCRAVPVSTTP